MSWEIATLAALGLAWCLIIGGLALIMAASLIRAACAVQAEEAARFDAEIRAAVFHVATHPGAGCRE